MEQILQSTTIVQDYELLEQIGSGQYGSVFKGKNFKNNKFYAIKVIKSNRVQKDSKLDLLLQNEMQVLAQINNPHVIKFYEMIKTQNNIYFVYEYCNGGDLQQFMKDKGPFSEEESIKIYKQLILAFKSLIQNNIIHRDLKPANILFHNNEELSNSMVGSPIYMAPELLQGKSYDSKGDIWSLGCVLYELLYNVCPFEDRNLADLLDSVKNKQVEYPDTIKISSQTLKLLKKLLQKDPIDRISWDDLFQLEKDSETKYIENDLNSEYQQQFLFQNDKLNNNNNFNGNQVQKQPIFSNVKFQENLIENYRHQDQINNQTQNLYQNNKNNNNIKNSFENSQNQIHHIRKYSDALSDQKLQQQQQPEKIFCYLMQERNKMLFIYKIIEEIIQKNFQTPDLEVVVFMMTKYLIQITQNIKQNLVENIKINKFPTLEKKLTLEEQKRISKINQYNIFCKSVQKEHEFSIQLFNQSREECKSAINNSNTLEKSRYCNNQFLLDEINQETFSGNFLKSVIMNYIEEIKNLFFDSFISIQNDSQSATEWLIHINKIQDCLLIDETFENQIKFQIIDLDTQPYYQLYNNQLKQELFKQMTNKMMYIRNITILI